MTLTSTSSGKASSQNAATTVSSTPPLLRTVARPVANLGNTCYMNAVLQALAHAPELCMAMDCEPHHVHCPVAAELAAKRRASPSSSPDHANGNPSSNANNSNNSNSNNNNSNRGGNTRKPATRKSLRASGRKSPQEGDDSARDPALFCALCEVEQHFRYVHDISKRDKPVAPSSFVHGFIDHVAPWFKLGVQEDSHEFLRLLIDAMQKSCERARKQRQQQLDKPKQQENSQDDDTTSAGHLRLAPSPTSTSATTTTAARPSAPATSATTAQTDNVISAERASSLVTPEGDSLNNSNKDVKEDKDAEYPFALFRGTVESNVTCESCGASSSTLDPIEDIGLEVLHPAALTPSPPLSTNNSSNQMAGAADRLSRNNSPVPPASSSYGGSAGASSNAAAAATVAASLSSASSSASLSLTDVQTAFCRFARAEALDAGYKCEKCGKVGRATKQSRLASIPPILTLHLKRFRYGDSRAVAAAMGVAASSTSTRRSGRSEVNQLLGSTADFLTGGKSGSAKIEGHIRFDLFFDIRPFLTQDLQKKHSNMFCRLFAVIVHSGKNSHSGHYIAYVRNVNKNDWWKMDDGRVTPASEMEVMSAEAYMLFYRVVQHPIAIHLDELNKKRIAKEQQLQQQKIALTTTANIKSMDMAAAAAAAADRQKSAAQLLTSCSKSENVNSILVESKPVSRKRTASELFACGEDWFRSKIKIRDNTAAAVLTSVPIPNEPTLYAVPLIQKIEASLARVMELTASAQQRLFQELSQGDSTVGCGPHYIPLTEDDIVGGTERYRQMFLTLAYRIFKHETGIMDNKDDDASAAWLVVGGRTTHDGGGGRCLLPQFLQCCGMQASSTTVASSCVGITNSTPATAAGMSSALGSAGGSSTHAILLSHHHHHNRSLPESEKRVAVLEHDDADLL